MRPLEFFDGESDSADNSVVIPFTVGSNFNPGDIRFAFVGFYNGGGSAYSAATAPAGWTRIAQATTGSVNYAAVFASILTNTSVDVNFSAVGACWWSLITARYADTTQSVWPGHFSTGPGSITTVSFSVNAKSDVVYFWAQGPSTDPGAIKTPTGWTTLTATDNSGDNYDNTSTDSGCLLAAQSFASGSGTIAPVTPTHVGSGYGEWIGVQINLAPDVTVTVGTAVTETDTANAATPSLLSKVTFPVQTALSEFDTAGQVFSPLTGIHTRNPLILPGDPVSASRVSWDSTVYAVGSTVIVQTSIDNGLTWQDATQNGPVPNLPADNTTIKSVLSRAILTRAAVTDQSPSVHSLEVSVACDGSVDEMVSLGVFLIEEVEINLVGGTSGGSGGSSGGGDGITGDGGGNSGGGLTLSISGTDLSLIISRKAWTDVYYLPYGTRYDEGIMAIIQDRKPDTVFNFISTEHTTPQLIFGTEQGNDPWQDVLDLAQAIGCELFFDANGICTLRPVPDPTQGDAVWEFNDGMSPTVVAVDRVLNDQTTYNYIVVTGETTSSETPVYAIAQDDNPSSPTYTGGDYGIKPYYWQSPEVLTTDQAQQAADALLRLSLGAADNTTVTVVPMPALEPGDIVAVNVAETKNNGNYLVNSMTTSVSAAEAQGLTVYRQG